MQNNLCTIYLVRHGESLGNILLNNPEQKWEDFGELGSDLSPLGREQAAERAKELQHIDFAAIFSSDLTRAKRTADIIKQDRELEIHTTKLLRERDWGNFGGRTLSDVAKELQKLQQGLSDREKMKVKATDSMESEAESVSRLITSLREISVAYANKTVLVVAHGNIMRSLLIHLGYVTYDELRSKTVTNTAYIVLESDGVDFFVKETKGIHKKDKNSI